MRIRSYGLCFAHERRIHQIDNWRIPVPYGIPLRGVAYAALTLLCVLLLANVPVLGDALGLLHPALRLVIVPAGVAYALCRLRFDGRPAHSAGLSWVRFRGGTKWVASCRPIEPPGPVFVADIAIASDERSARYRPGVVGGPAEVVLRRPAKATRSGATIRLASTVGGPMWRGKRLSLGSNQRLVIR